MGKRTNPRFPVRIPVFFSGDGINGEGTVIDLSRGGEKATITSNLRVQTGTYLTLGLSLPDQAPPVRVDLGAVRWSLGMEFGVELLFMGTAGADRLERYFTSLEPVPNY